MFLMTFFSFGLFGYAAGEPSAVEVRSYFGARFQLFSGIKKAWSRIAY